ncbi:hypothetical protein MSG28_010414, partial [Choristoneura fumiferana]
MAAKKCHRWLDEEVIAFLKLYKNMECLWNTRLRDHKDRNKRERAYEMIKAKLGLDDLTVLDIKNKIRGIRTTYSDELNKIVSSMKCGESDVYKPKVFWFNIADSFLRGVTKHGLGAMFRKKEEASFAADESLQHQDTEEDLDFSDNANLIELPPLLPERHSPENNALNPVLVSKEEDEYDLFGRSMAMQLRKMPELTALELMQKMQLMVLNSRKQLSNKKIKMKQRITKPVHAPSTSNTNSKRTRSPSPDVSSQSTPSPCYKFEVMSPTERDPTSAIGDETDRSFTYEQPNSYERWTHINSSKMCIDYVLPKSGMYENHTVKYFVILETPEMYETDIGFVASALLISCVFLVIVLIVYALLPELRNLCGLILMSYVASLFGGFLMLATLQLMIKHGDVRRFMLYLKLSVIMGVSWVLEVVSFLAPQFSVWYLTDAYNLLIGVSIFLIFICKKKIYNKLRKRVTDEVEALEAILMDDVVIKRVDDVPQSIETVVHPSTGDDTDQQYVCVTLEVKLTPGYPDNSPEVTLRNPRGLDDALLAAINSQIQEKLIDCLGQPVVFELLEQTCPVCRCALTCDVDTLKKAPAPVESITAPPFRLTAELKALQLKMAALLSQQVAKGGVVAVGDTGPPPLTITSPADNENEASIGSASALPDAKPELGNGHNGNASHDAPGSPQRGYKGPY